MGIPSSTTKLHRVAKAHRTSIQGAPFGESPMRQASTWSTRRDFDLAALLEDRNRLFDLDEPAEALVISCPATHDGILCLSEPGLVWCGLNVQMDVFDGVEGRDVET